MNTFHLDQLYHWADKKLPNPHISQQVKVLYVIALIACAVAIQLTTPIKMGDTDMWYHLADGKYFWETGTIASTLYYSFIDAGDFQFHNHFWGFQVVIAKIYEHTGYAGLLIFRSLLVATSLIVIAALIFNRKNSGHYWLKIIILVAFTSLIIGRGYQLRPHLFSYIMIPAFLYVLEYRRDLVYVLPVLAVIWLNTHAVGWVIGALICGSYVLEEIIRRKQQADKKFIGIILLCLPAFLLTPAPWELIKEPFIIPIGTLGNFILELLPINTAAFTQIQLNITALNPTSAFTFLFFLSLYLLFILVKNRKLRLSHFLIAAGGFFLLTRGNRFIWEWSLLVLPLLAAGLSELTSTDSKKSEKSTRYILLFLALIPVYSILSAIDLKQPYPYNPSNLPTGISKFLVQTKSKGNLLAPSNEGGFFHQQLYPNILIFGDMKLPEITLRETASALSGPVGFKTFIKKYKVDFIYLRDAEKLKDTLKETGYKVIFLDDTGYLYAHIELQKELLATHDIKFDIRADFTKIPTNIFVSEMDRLIKIDSNEKLLIALITKLFKDKQHELAMKYAEILKAKHPFSPAGYYWIGNLYENTSNCETALKYFNQAYAISDDAFRKKLNRHMGTCHYVLKNFKASYEAFSQSINIYLNKETPEDLFQYAFASIVVGELNNADEILKTLIETTDDTKKDLKDSALELKNKLDTGKFEVPSFMDWIWHKLLGMDK